MRALLGMQPRMGQVPPDPVALDRRATLASASDGPRGGVHPGHPGADHDQVDVGHAPDPTRPRSRRSPRGPPVDRWPRGLGYRVLTTERRWSYCIAPVEVAVARGVPPTRKRQRRGCATRPSAKPLLPPGPGTAHGRPGPFSSSSGPPSSSGPGHRPFKAAARVRIPLGASGLETMVSRAIHARAVRSVPPLCPWKTAGPHERQSPQSGRASTESRLAMLWANVGRHGTRSAPRSRPPSA